MNVRRILLSLCMVVIAGAGLAQSSHRKFELMKLPYALNALEPVISAETLSLHHGKHLNTYVNNLNKLIAGTKFEQMELEEIVATSEGALFNNAGQTLNHNLYFTQFSPEGGGTPVGNLSRAIDAQWGNFDKFKEEFTKSATALFGSGWVWLSKDASGKLYITQEANGGNPVIHGLIPILGIDVWEHAYYVDYRNNRAAHLDAVWKIIDWAVLNRRYTGV